MRLTINILLPAIRQQVKRQALVIHFLTTPKWFFVNERKIKKTQLFYMAYSFIRKTTISAKHNTGINKIKWFEIYLDCGVNTWCFHTRKISSNYNNCSPHVLQPRKKKKLNYHTNNKMNKLFSLEEQTNLYSVQNLITRY